MKYVIVSDSHGDRDILVKLVEKYQNEADLILHCGDSELRSNDELFTKMYVVMGNCDFDSCFDNERIIQRGPDRMFLTHGHLYGVNFGLDKLDYQMQAESCQIAFYGHTHQLYADYGQGRLIVNPGSISQPRGPYAKLGGTYAVLESSKEAYHVQYYNRQFEPVENLKAVFKRD